MGHVATGANTLANDDLHDTAYTGERGDDRGDVAGDGALQILRAAYAAAYRQMFRSTVSLRHTGTPDTIFEHPKERERNLDRRDATGGRRGNERRSSG